MRPAADLTAAHSLPRMGISLLPKPPGYGKNVDDPAESALPATIDAPRCLVQGTRDAFRERAQSVIDGFDGAVVSEQQTIVIDFRDTVEMDTSGLGMLILMHKRAGTRGLRMRLIGVRGAVRRLLMLTRTDHLFDLA